MQNDLLDVYVMITHGPAAGNHARIINVKTRYNVKDCSDITKYVVEIVATANDNNQVTILSRDEFEIK